MKKQHSTGVTVLVSSRAIGAFDDNEGHKHFDNFSPFPMLGKTWIMQTVFMTTKPCLSASKVNHLWDKIRKRPHEQFSAS